MKPDFSFTIASRNITGVLSLFLIVMIAGCGSRPAPTSLVQGKVTYQGMPLENGVLIFIPVDGSLPSARADIQSNGQFELATVPGEYKVTVTQLAASKSEFEPDDPRYIPPKSLLPAKYSSISQSPLVCNVTEQNSTVEFTLTAK